MDYSTLDEVLQQLEGVIELGNGQYMARCPEHDDQTASLAIRLGDNGKVLLLCHAGCDWRRVYDTLSVGQANAPQHKGQLIWTPTTTVMRRERCCIKWCE